MNNKVAKKYRQKAKELTVDWIELLLIERKAVTIDTFQDYMEQKYVYANRKFMLSAFSERIYQNLKKINKDIDSVTLIDSKVKRGYIRLDRLKKMFLNMTLGGNINYTTLF